MFEQKKDCKMSKPWGVGGMAGSPSSYHIKYATKTTRNDTATNTLDKQNKHITIILYN